MKIILTEYYSFRQALEFLYKTIEENDVNDSTRQINAGHTNIDQLESNRVTDHKHGFECL